MAFKKKKVDNPEDANADSNETEEQTKNIDPEIVEASKYINENYIGHFPGDVEKDLLAGILVELIRLRKATSEE